MSELAEELRKFHKPVNGVRRDMLGQQTIKVCQDDNQGWPCNTEIAIIRSDER